MRRADGHAPVLRDAAVDGLRVQAGGCYLDCTFGRGGHAAAILDRLGPDGRLFAIDRDPEAVAAARERFGGDRRFRIAHANFAFLGDALARMGCDRLLDGVLLDLGVSSPQLDTAVRGFSFRADGPLDMRMDRSVGPTAAEWLAKVPREALERVLREFGEERYARRIAGAIVARRAETPIETTRALAELVASVVPGRERARDPATRTFQAIRIAVNDELAALERALDQCLEHLAPGGRLVVISFHSLEDRRVKRFISQHATPPAGNRRLPEQAGWEPRLRRCGKARRPSSRECQANPRARSAVLRIAERTDAM